MDEDLETTRRAAGPEANDDLDTGVLPALFARLGPIVATALRVCLAEDLAIARSGIVAALSPAPDASELARHAHVLIALAGTAGGTLLHGLARALHRAAVSGDGPRMRRLADQVLPATDALMAVVRACPPDGCKAAS